MNGLPESWPLAWEEIREIAEKLYGDLAPIAEEVISDVDRHIDSALMDVGDLLGEIIHKIIDWVWLLLRDSWSEISFYLGLMDAVRTVASLHALEQLRPTPLDSSAALSLFYKFPERRDFALAELAKQGFSPERIDALIEAARTVPDFGFIREAVFRGIIDMDTAKEYFRQHGYNEYDTELLSRIMWYVAPAQDVIRFAVREVYSPEIAERFGQYEDYPVEAEEDAAKAGISPDLLKKYWAAHWDLPGISAGYEMLHRLDPAFVEKYPEKFTEMGLDPERVKTTLEDLKLLLRAQDVMPFWREKLLAISYAPLTRVDVRRMYKLGVLDEEDVYWSYRELGYDHVNSMRLTVFTRMEAIESERDLTKSEILKAYEEKLVSREMAKEYLEALRYSEDEADLLIQMSDFKIEKELKETRIKVIRTKYLKHVIDEAEMRRELSKLALSGSEIDAYATMWTIEREEKAEELSLTDLKDAVKYGVITQEEFREKLKARGYSDRDIEILWEIQRQKSLGRK